MGNGGADSGFDAIDSIFIGLSSGAAGTALIPPHSRHLPMISHFPSGFTQMLTGSRIPPHEKPSPSSSCTAERQLGQCVRSVSQVFPEVHPQFGHTYGLLFSFGLLFSSDLLFLSIFTLHLMNFIFYTALFYF